MKKSERVEYRRLGAVAHHLKQHESLIASNLAVQQARTDLEAILAEIEHVLHLQMKGSKPTTASKNAKRKMLVRDLLMVTGHLASVAARLNDEGLLETTSLTPSLLRKLPDEDLGQLGKVILEAARTWADELEEQEFYPYHTDGYETVLDTFLDAVGSPRMVINTRKTGTTSLPDLLKRGMRILRRRLSRLLLAYQIAEPEFYRGYVEATVLKGVAVHHEGADGAVDSSAA
jgi:hypothetical protein